MVMGFGKSRGLLPSGQDDEDDALGLLGSFGIGKRKPPYGAPPMSPLDPAVSPSGIGTASAASPSSFWDGGDGFSLHDGLAGGMAVISDALAQNNGQQGFATPMLMQGRAAKFAADKAAREAAVKRAAEFQDWRTREQWKRDNPEEAYGTFEDNAGNQWRYNKRTGKAEANPMFVDPNDRQFVVDGQMVTVPNAVRSQQGPPAGNLDATPTVEDGYQYTPGPGGRANQSNWKAVGGGAGNGAGNFRRR